MTTLPTPRFTLPDPNRPPMTPLPAELLAHILKLAQEGDSPPEQLKTRWRFERVCKGWYLCDNKWRVVAVRGIEQVEKLLAAFEALAAAGGGEAGAGGGEDVALGVRSIYFRLDKKLKPKDELVGRLISRLEKVEAVEFLFNGAGFAEEYDDCFGKATSAALAKLIKVKHLAVGRDASAYKNATVHLSALKRLLAQWPKLESLAFRRCHLKDQADVPGLFANLRRFTTLELSRPVGSRAIQHSILRELPPTTRSVKVDADSLFNASPGNPREPFERTQATKIESLTLMDGAPAMYRSWRPTEDRGLFDDFIASLDNVTHLTISPLALTDIASLAHLKKLTHLNLRFGCFIPNQVVPASELLNLFNNSTSLKRVLVASAISKNWSAQEKRQLREAAKPNIIFA